MGALDYLRELEASFMEGLHTPLSPPLFNVRVKKAAAPISKRQLSKKHQQVASKIAKAQAWLMTLCQQFMPELDCADEDLANLWAKAHVKGCLELQDIADPEGRYLWEPLVTFVERVAGQEAMLQPLPALDLDDLAPSEYYAFYSKLEALERFADDHETVLGIWSQHMTLYLHGLLDSLPSELVQARKDIDLTLSAKLVESFDSPHEELAMTLRHFIGCDSQEIHGHDLFSELRDTLLDSMLAASGIQLEDLAKKEPDTPLNHLDTAASEVATRFFAKTPFTKLFLTPVPYVF